jgi:UDP-N-acetylglucosamine--N-acetylmuramyl-(pentapeptide) pyrophosphoryl-undecaprenol N-acetylglucosamine transferase
MKIVVTGGGSGGHITPILAVAQELRRIQAVHEVVYIGQRGDKLADIPAADPNIDSVYTVSAGKLRRYSGEGWKQLLDLRTQWLNIRDMFRVLAGTWQSFWLLRKLRPDVIFTRGGFVSVPVALGGHLLGIPYITHDSDSTPSLANRLIARWAKVHAVALPAELYPYPHAKTEVVGVPISQSYIPVDDLRRRSYRQELSIPEKGKVVLLTGGGNGARLLNEALVANARYLLGTYPDLTLLHITGRDLEDETRAAYEALQIGNALNRVKIVGFVTDLYRYSGAADIVIARGGATNLAEFARQGVACLIVPSKHLGWNVKNAAALAERGAIEQLTEDQVEQPERLGRTLGSLLENDEARAALASAISTYARPEAAADLARLIVRVGTKETDVRAEK